MTMQQKIALITGATRGIGAALAVQLGRTGAQCILLGRTVGGLEATDDAIRQAGGSPALLVPIDFKTADQEFDQLGATLYERFGRLDYFCACAAQIGPLSPVGHIQPKDWRDIMAINLTANYRLIRSLDPLLKIAAKTIPHHPNPLPLKVEKEKEKKTYISLAPREGGEGRGEGEAANTPTALFLTCSQASMAEAYWGAYGASKAGLGNLAQSYAAETEATNIRVILHDPGATNTKLRQQAFPGEDKSRLPSAEDAAAKIFAMM